MKRYVSCGILGLFVVSVGACGVVGGTSDAASGGGGSNREPSGDSGVSIISNPINGGGSASHIQLSVGDAGAATNPDIGPAVCDRIKIDTTSIPPRVLFLQDVSSSMRGQWRPLHDGMVAVAKQFGDRMSLGFVPFSSIYFDRLSEIRSATAAEFQTFFKAHDNDCEISDSALIAPAASGAAKIIAAYDSVDSERMVGGTPTYAAMEQARKILVDNAPKDNSPGYAILVTDGAPNCSSPTGNAIADVQTSITKLANAGINTFVVGYNYSGAALDQWAKAGNTSKYINVSDTSKLSEAISGILVGVLPCQFALSAPVEKAKYVRVTVDAKDRELNNPDNGWTLGSDQKTITLTGTACSDLRSNGAHTIDVAVECAEVIIF